MEQGAGSDFKMESNGKTPLHNCVKANHPVRNYILKILLRAGANPNTQTIPNQVTGAFMRDAFTKAETPLHRAAAFGNEESIRLLVDAGADKSITDINNESPIWWASWHCRPGKILALLSHGKHRIHQAHTERM